MSVVVTDLVVAELERLHERVARRFGRAEPRRRVREYMSGLVAGLERKNGWPLAERAGEVSPDGMQRLLRRADWDVDGVRDDVRDYVTEHLGETGGVLIVDDTGFVKKGMRSAGVQRQYSGTAGRTEHCPIGCRPGQVRTVRSHGSSSAAWLGRMVVSRVVRHLVVLRRVVVRVRRCRCVRVGFVR
jgi:SRSO17 transposase